MKTMLRNVSIRIALESNMHDERLQNLYGDVFKFDIENLKVWLQNKSGLEYSLVVHDRDNTFNKPHLHLVMRYTDCQRCFNLDSLRSMFPVGYIESCRSFDACLLYLLHRGHADKVPYSVDELFTNIDYYERFPFLKKEVY